MERKLAFGLALGVACVLGGPALDNRALAQDTPQPELKKLRVLMVIDTYAPRLKEIVQFDKQHMQDVLKQGIPPDRYTVDYIEGKNAIPSKILEYYANLQTGPDEALLFFYSGHGGMTEKEHYLTIEGDGKAPYTFGGVRYYRLARTSVVNVMSLKKPGLAVVLTACCSAKIPARPDTTVGAPPPREEVPKQIKPVIKSLFFEQRGVVDITAAPPGEVALGLTDKVFGTQGGTFFTSHFADLALQDDLSKFKAKGNFVTWNAFQDRLKRDMDVNAKFVAAKLQEEWQKTGEKADEKMLADLSVQVPYDFQLANKGKVARPKWRLGLVVDTFREGTGLKILDVVAGTPAGKAGLSKGDVILSMNGRTMKAADDFTRAIADSEGKLSIEFRSAATGNVEKREVMLEKAE